MAARRAHPAGQPSGAVAPRCRAGPPPPDGGTGEAAGARPRATCGGKCWLPGCRLKCLSLSAVNSSRLSWSGCTCIGSCSTMLTLGTAGPACSYQPAPAADVCVQGPPAPAAVHQQEEKQPYVLSTQELRKKNREVGAECTARFLASSTGRRRHAAAAGLLPLLCKPPRHMQLLRPLFLSAHGCACAHAAGV